MKLALISLFSAIHEGGKIGSSLSPYREELDERFQVTEFDAEELNSESLDSYDLVAVFVKTGGTENAFREIFRDLPEPVYLIATPLHNSLPASLEILSWVKQEHGRGRIIHGTPEEVAGKLEDLARVAAARRAVSSGRMGVIGKPSDWLIASGVNYEKVEGRWGLDLVDVDLGELYSQREKFHPPDVEDRAEVVIEGSSGSVENSREDTLEATRTYFALKSIIADYELTALTLRCFDLVTELDTTGCLALSLLNDEGVVSGCEGDVPAAFTMLAGYHLTGSVPFMANPVEVDEKEKRVVFAHCTVPTSMTDGYVLRSHFESGIGVGLQGMIPQGPVTLVKIGGKELDRYFVGEGELVENLSRSTACRTQVAVEFEPYVWDYLLHEPLANHHVLIPGRHGKAIEEFMDRPD